MSFGNSSCRIVVAVAALAIAALLGGCTSSQELIQASARPGKYRLYNCQELTTRGIELLKREAELRELIARAKQGPGGEIVVVLAYQTDYNQTRGELLELENTGADKKCTLKHRTVSDQVVR